MDYRLSTLSESAEHLAAARRVMDYAREYAGIDHLRLYVKPAATEVTEHLASSIRCIIHAQNRD